MALIQLILCPGIRVLNTSKIFIIALSMKKIFILMMVLSLFSIAPAQELNVMTFNIRLNISSDSLNAWPFRKDKLASEILFHGVHLLGVQEALHGQMMDLKERLPQFFL
jgi:hypothetical protein